MLDENLELRNSVMSQFKLDQPVGTANSKPIPHPCQENTNPHARVDSLQALAMHEEQLRKANETSVTDKKEKFSDPTAVDSISLLSKVLENKKEEVDEVDLVRERANKTCIDTDIMEAMFRR